MCGEWRPLCGALGKGKGSLPFCAPMCQVEAGLGEIMSWGSCHGNCPVTFPPGQLDVSKAQGPQQPLLPHPAQPVAAELSLT